MMGEARAEYNAHAQSCPACTNVDRGFGRVGFRRCEIGKYFARRVLLESYARQAIERRIPEVERLVRQRLAARKPRITAADFLRLRAWGVKL